jgi:hypothetical protein
MNVLVDTSVWSLALRRPKGLVEPENLYIAELRELIKEMRVQIIGPIRQEILSGLANRTQFEKLRDYLRSFQDLSMDSSDYERAAEFFNLCRSLGVQGSQIDFLICAVAVRYNTPILTTDKDFSIYAQYLDIELHSPRSSLQ